MHLLCPHCQNLIELVEIRPGEEIACPSCGSSFKLEGGSTTAYQPLQGQKLGKFELLDRVGVGAFGTVYKARDPELNRTVAIKVPRAGNLADGHDRDRFLREARSVAQLRHPSIVTVHEVGQVSNLAAGPGEVENLPYLVSDFVEGITLTDLLSAPGRRPGFRESAELIAQVADALQYAHDHGVVHRDVKPSNIMLERGGLVTGGQVTGERQSGHQATSLPAHQPTSHHVRLMDFGLAKRDAGEVTMTVDGQVLGTPAYMSPEQARGEAHRVDGRSDVYSLGVILYQLAAGELPFRGNTRMLLHQVLHDDPRPPRSLNDRIPRDLETICLKCLQKEPARRYASAGALADDLRRFLKGEPIKARPVGQVERLWRWCKRKPGLALSVTTATVGLLALLGAVGIYFHRVNVTRQLARDLAADAKAQAHGGDIDGAVGGLTAAKAICQKESALASLEEALTDDIRQLRNYRDFRRSAQNTLRVAPHGFGARERPDRLTQQCEEALGIYQVLEDAQWHTRLAEETLTGEQIAEIKRLAAEMLTTMAIRLALLDTRDEAGKAATRRALDLLDRAEALQPPTTAVWTLRMLYHRRLGQHPQADRAGDLMVSTPPTTATDFYLLGSVTLQVAKNPTKSVEFYRRALALEANHYGANLGLYFASHELKDVQGEIAALNVCLALRPDQAPLYYFRGFALFSIQEYERAYVDFDSLVQRDSKNPQGYYWRGRCHFLGTEDREKLIRAERDFSRALELDAKYSSPYQWRAMARAKLNRYQEAVQDAEAALKEHNEPMTPWYAARAYAQAARAVLADAKAPDRQKLSDQYGSRAVELLAAAMANGFTALESYQKSNDLDPLRERRDFQQLLNRLVFHEALQRDHAWPLWSSWPRP